MKAIVCKKCKDEITVTDARGKKLMCGGALYCSCGSVGLDWMPLDDDKTGARAEQMYRVIGDEGNYRVI